MLRLSVFFGAADPEAALAQRLCSAAGVTWAQVTKGGKPVHGGNAYAADGYSGEPIALKGHKIVLFECDLPGWFSDPALEIIRCDHHRPGDPGFGQPPKAFLTASSLGQLIQLFQLPVCSPGEEIKLTAAADHCLEAAYRGRCPGVAPRALLSFRVAQKAAFQKRPEAAVLEDIVAAVATLRFAFEYQRGLAPDGKSPEFADLRAKGRIPELPEAAAVEGIPFLAEVQEPSPGTIVRVAAEGLPDDGPDGMIVRYLPPRKAELIWGETPDEALPLSPQQAEKLAQEWAEGNPDEGWETGIIPVPGRKKVVLQAAPADLVLKFLAGELIPDLIDRYGDPARGIAGGYVPASPEEKLRIVVSGK